MLIEKHNIELAHTNALAAARKAAQDFADKHFGGGDGGPCGFAHVAVYGIRSNSKVGKALAEVTGAQKWSYDKAFHIRNTWYMGQSVDAAAAGADAYRAVFKQLTGLDKVYASSRLD
jgi:hypothetical protein